MTTMGHRQTHNRRTHEQGTANVHEQVTVNVCLMNPPTTRSAYGRRSWAGLCRLHIGADSAGRCHEFY
jgi:hypothetical protein